MDDRQEVDDIINDAKLTRAEKIERLEKMKVDAEALQRATAEGMEGDDEPNLRRIELALDEVERQAG